MSILWASQLVNPSEPESFIQAVPQPTMAFDEGAACLVSRHLASAELPCHPGRRCGPPSVMCTSRCRPCPTTWLAAGRRPWSASSPRTGEDCNWFWGASPGIVGDEVGLLVSSAPALGIRACIACFRIGTPSLAPVLERRVFVSEPAPPSAGPRMLDAHERGYQQLYCAHHMAASSSGTMRSRFGLQRSQVATDGARGCAKSSRRAVYSILQAASTIS